MSDEQRITFRDDLDGLDDDETIVEDPDIRQAKRVLFALTIGVLGVLILVLLVFFQPEGQVVVERWPNGYAKSRTTYVAGPGPDGRVPHGLHRAWHENGGKAEEGRYERGERVGEWRYWDEQGHAIEAPASPPSRTPGAPLPQTSPATSRSGR